MKRMGDGSVISSYFGLESAPSGDNVYNEGLRFTLGQIEKIHFTDEASNVSKQFVEYDVSVRDAKGGQSTFRNVRAMSSLFGVNDFEETILEDNKFAFKGKLETANFFGNKNGTIVVIAFMHGSIDKPFIVGTWQHPKYKGAKKADGIRKKGEFRGIQWNINKDGEFTLTYLGNRTPDHELVREDTGPTEVKIDKDGVMTFTDVEKQKFEMNRKTKTFTFSNGTTVTFDGKNDKVLIKTDGGLEASFDGKADKIDLKTSGGAEVKVDGDADKIDIKTSGGAEAKLDGNADKITVMSAGGAQALVDGIADQIKLITAGNAELNLALGKIALGTPVAEVLQQISDILTQLISALTAESTHTHNIITPLPGNPVGPPSSAGSLITAVANLTAIQILINSIKGSL